jgi:hypothetical protein
MFIPSRFSAGERTGRQSPAEFVGPAGSTRAWEKAIGVVWKFLLIIIFTVLPNRFVNFLYF